MRSPWAAVSQIVALLSWEGMGHAQAFGHTFALRRICLTQMYSNKLWGESLEFMQFSRTLRSLCFLIYKELHHVSFFSLVVFSKYDLCHPNGSLMSAPSSSP